MRGRQGKPIVPIMLNSQVPTDEDARPRLVPKPRTFERPLRHLPGGGGGGVAGGIGSVI